MLIGQSGFGKTTIYETLLETINYLYNCDPNNSYVKTEIYKINPKAILNKYLYGFINNLSNDWIDGIIPIIVKSILKNPYSNFNFLF